MEKIEEKKDIYEPLRSRGGVPGLQWFDHKKHLFFRVSLLTDRDKEGVVGDGEVVGNNLHRGVFSPGRPNGRHT